MIELLVSKDINTSAQTLGCSLQLSFISFQNSMDQGGEKQGERWEYTTIYLIDSIRRMGSEVGLFCDYERRL